MILLDYSQIAIGGLMAELTRGDSEELSLPLVRHMILNSIRNYNNKFRKEYGELVICCDSKNGYWRKRVFPHYKANRKETRKESPFDWKEIFTVLRAVQEEIADYLPYKVLEVPGAEADDIIATLAKRAANTVVAGGNIFDDKREPVLIISGDQDFCQLQMYPNVKQFSPLQKKWITLGGEHVESVIQEHILSGDRGDGIPNFLSPDDVFVRDDLRQKPLRKTKLEDWKDADRATFLTTDELKRNFERNQTLIDFRFIPPEIGAAILTAYDEAPEKDSSRLLTYFIKNRMKNLLEHIGEF